ncbi:putative glycolipid-binding domain-containing protein [Larsenimonas rhizosphaerae]|uniref:Glycolipid-binding domain-containing protein n=1 Tax=Larsenimonas rhizosphaerae TaxID=2944682 RepID=A0AA42CU81_9GAMM|nr:putative glycolipid-binding domain-containing protein [Larsenimonas rhizosphaerae]MCX2524029.1 putative glycolipid-binding domain-containing protein [Larsenimonas rhizosphaerae]
MLTCCWRNLETNGLEEASLRESATGVHIDSHVIDSPVSGVILQYQLSLDPHWRLREATVQVRAGERLVLKTDGAGYWQVNDRACPALEGCTDVDIAATPLTNTLPIRRLGLAHGDSATIDVVMVAVPSLQVTCVRQHYLRHDASHYRYSGLDTGTSSELRVDEHGLVQCYPGVFTRQA